MEWLRTTLISWLQGIQQTALERYGVDPIVWLIIATAASPVFYYSIYRLVKALARKQGNQIMLWSTVFLATTVAPYIYVLLFGRNLPWWIYAAMALLIGQGVYSLVRKLLAKPKEPPAERSKEPTGEQPPKQAGG